MDQVTAVTFLPLLREVQDWLTGPRQYPLAPGLADDIAAAVQELSNDDVQPGPAAEEPLLLVLLLGGSGTGKSTLFNALAGDQLAPVSVTRPTTTVPIAYVHADVPWQRLAVYPPLQDMQLVRHHRAGLRQKIVIDTPDFDTHQARREHRQLVLDLLPWCDLVLFVVSPEKYVDQATWEVLLSQVQHRAFAFVLSKADLVYDDGGTPPHVDLLAMVQALGYRQPRLYRVAAEQWFQYRTGLCPEPPQEDGFLALELWLEDELQRDDVAALKATLHGRKVERLRQALCAARPPALAQAIATLRQAWEVTLHQAAETFEAAVQEPVRAALSRLQMEVVIEQHRQFRGLLGGYFSLVDLLHYGPTLLLQYLRQEPAGQPFILARLGDVLRGPQAHEAWQRLHLHLRYAVGQLTVDIAGTAPLHWIDERLRPLEQHGPTWLVDVLPGLLAELQTPAMATHPAVRGLQQVCKWLFELLPTLFVGLCGYQLTVSFWQGQYLGGAFLWHAGALLFLLCLLLHGGVGLVFPLAWPRRHRRFAQVLAAQLRRLLYQRYVAVLDDFAQVIEQEQQHLDRLCAQLQAQQHVVRGPERSSLQGVFTTRTSSTRSGM